MTYLTVVTPFGSYSVGDKITDAGVVLWVLSGEHASKVIATGDAAVPAVPPAAGDIATLQQQFEDLTSAYEDSQAALVSVQSSNAVLQQTVSQNTAQIGQLNLMLVQVLARLGPGNPLVPIDLSDDKPITTNAGVRIRTMSGGTLVGNSPA